MKTDQTHINRGLYLVGSLYPDIVGGMEIFNYYFIREKLKEKHSYLYYIGNGLPQAGNGEAIAVRFRKPVRLFYPFQLLRAIWRIRKKIDYAYISFAEQSWILSLSQTIILRLLKIPYIVTIHWGKAPEWPFPYPFRWHFRKAFAVVGVSDLVCQYYEAEIKGLRTVCIPPLIPFNQPFASRSAARQKLGFESRENIILFVGSLKDMKNPGDLLNALAIIDSEKRKKNSIRIVFAGDGPMRPTLEAQVARLGLEQHVVFAGIVQREDLPAYFKAADVYVSCSDYEGTSVSLLEAMYNKLPVVASNVPGNNAMVKDQETALLYTVRQVNELAEKLLTVMDNREWALAMADRGYAAYQERYAYEGMLAAYTKLFADASERKKHK